MIPVAVLSALTALNFAFWLVDGFWLNALAGGVGLCSLAVVLALVVTA